MIESGRYYGLCATPFASFNVSWVDLFLLLDSEMSFFSLGQSSGQEISVRKERSSYNENRIRKRIEHAKKKCAIPNLFRNLHFGNDNEVIAFVFAWDAG